MNIINFTTFLIDFPILFSVLISIEKITMAVIYKIYNETEKIGSFGFCLAFIMLSFRYIFISGEISFSFIFSLGMLGVSFTICAIFDSLK